MIYQAVSGGESVRQASRAGQGGCWSCSPCQAKRRSRLVRGGIDLRANILWIAYNQTLFVIDKLVFKTRAINVVASKSSIAARSKVQKVSVVGDDRVALVRW